MYNEKGCVSYAITIQNWAQSHLSKLGLVMFHHIFHFEADCNSVREQIVTPLCTGQDTMNILDFLAGCDDLTERYKVQYNQRVGKTRSVPCQAWMW